MRPFACAIAVAVTLSLTACAGGGGPRKPTKRQVQMIDRVLTSAPGAAQPSNIVAAELAFSRAAREQGQWTAFRLFAAPGALLHGANGPFEILPWLATQTDPAAAVQWKPRTVVMSCDGALAVSQGRFTEPDGTVGNFVTVWERQPDGAYRYVFDAGGPDVPQPPPRKRIEDGDIVVTEMDAIQGLVATCPRGGGVIPAAPPPLLSNARLQVSRDGTLRWGWAHKADGTRYFGADYFYQGRWVTAIEQNLVPTGN
jgi:hypothetical protein